MLKGTSLLWTLSEAMGQGGPLGVKGGQEGLRVSC